jgi:hypothetical protein
MAATLSLPPIEALDAAAATLIDQAAGHASAERAINKALWQLQSGIELRPTVGGFLLPSNTRAGVIHRVSNVNGCNCEAALSGHTCWHASVIAIIEEAQRYTRPTMPAMPTGDKLARARKALTEMQELFG